MHACYKIQIHMKFTSLCALGLLCCASFSSAGEKPNIVLILADDQSYGDLNSYNTQCGFPTPGTDRLAAEGMRFTDAHSGSAVCTPTRYGIMTGRYAWRSRLQRGVLQTGIDPLIADDLLTVPQMLKKEGYQTAIVGKWHLGFRYQIPKGATWAKKIKGEKIAIPVGAKVIGGPTTRGFDQFWGFHHAGEMRTWIEQDKVVKNFLSQSEMLPNIATSSVDYIKKQGEAQSGKKGSPFFLYIPLNSPHGPLVPTKEWKGKSGLNVYADFVMHTDDVIHRILAAIDDAGLKDNTLVVFTSDNGTSPISKLAQLRAKGHDPILGLKGHKADIWEGGHRVPFLVRWPGVITAGSVSKSTICHNNLMATCAEILGVTLPDDAGVDSHSILPHLKGNDSLISHPVVIHHSVNGKFAIRQGKWKFIACKGSGGWSKGNDGKKSQLFDMSVDLQEKNNVVENHPEVVQKLTKKLETVVERGRSRPGARQKNDVPVKIWK